MTTHDLARRLLAEPDCDVLGASVAEGYGNPSNLPVIGVTWERDEDRTVARIHCFEEPADWPKPGPQVAESF